MSLESAAAMINPVQAIPAIVGKMGFDQQADARKARKAQERLEEQRRATLAREAADREAARKRAETAGQRVGLSRTGLVGAPSVGGDGAPTLFGN